MLAFLDNHFDRWRHGPTGDGPLAALLLFPVIVILGAFGIAPLFYAVFLSFQKMRGNEASFVGFANYREALFGEPLWDSFLVTLYFAIGTVPVAMAISFLIASALFRIQRFRGILRTVYFLPYITSVVAAATIWRVLLNPRAGIANKALSWFGIAEQQWLLEPRGLLAIVTNGFVPNDVGPSLSLCCVMLFEIWHSSGFMIVVLLAGLSAIPRDLEDAARIDGANWWQLTRTVTLPMLSPTLFFLSIVSVIKSFQAFSSFYALTGDGRGPLDTTQNLTVYIFSNFYEFQRLGYGAAVATFLCTAIVALTALQWRLVGKRVYYQ